VGPEGSGRILLLTTWKAHLEAFRLRFEAVGLEPVVFTGAMKTMKREVAVDRLCQH